MNSELLKVIESEVEDECARIRDQAKTESAEIARQAGEQARALLQQTEEECQAQERSARLKAQSAANLTASAMVLEAKARAIDELFRLGLDRLRSLPPDQYRPVLKRLIQEAGAGFAPGFTVKVGREDVKAGREIVKELGWQATVVEEPQVGNGAIVSDAKGALTVYNRFQDRLDKIRPALVSILAREVWG